MCEPVTSLLLTNKTGFSLSLSWSPPDLQRNYTYTVSYVAIFSTDSSSPLVTAPTTNTSIVLSSLSVGTTYRIEVTAAALNASNTRSLVCGARTGAAVEFTTVPLAPAAAPTQIVCLALAGQSMRISFVRLSEADSRGQIVSYGVFYQRVPGQARANMALTGLQVTGTVVVRISEVTVNAASGVSVLSITLPEPGMKYTLQVQANNDIGSGPLSDPVIASTLDAGTLDSLVKPVLVLIRVRLQYLLVHHCGLWPRQQT